MFYRVQRTFLRRKSRGALEPRERTSERLSSGVPLESGRGRPGSFPGAQQSFLSSAPILLLFSS